MSGKLAAELKQTRPFSMIEEEALLNVIRTHEHIQQRQNEFFRPFQLTPTQYNVLRILRGAGAEGLTCSQAAERMLTADPDVTRLLDRLEIRGLIARERSKQDRRVVLSHITPSGMDLLASIDEPLAAFLREEVGPVGPARLAQLVEILESMREK
jgi:DNA-binding MarR family transcriptional regulator